MLCIEWKGNEHKRDTKCALKRYAQVVSLIGKRHPRYLTPACYVPRSLCIPIEYLGKGQKCIKREYSPARLVHIACPGALMRIRILL